MMSTGLQTEKLPRLFEELCDEDEKHIDEITVVLSERVIREKLLFPFALFMMIMTTKTIYYNQIPNQNK
jgi:hypothetical protein